MAAFLKILPLELRNQIYEELLVDKINAVEPMRGSSYTTSRKRLYPAILQTCKQIHREGKIPFQEQNHFRYALFSCESLERDHFPGPYFPHIQHLELAYYGSALKLPYGSTQQSIVRRGSVIASMRHLVYGGCRFRTFRLEFIFLPTHPFSPTSSLYVSDEQMRVADLSSLVADDDIKALLALVFQLHVSETIELVVKSRCQIERKVFKELAYDICYSKGWAVAEEHHSPLSRTDITGDEDEINDGDGLSQSVETKPGDMTNFFTWTLKPTDKHTKQCGLKPLD